MTNKLKKLVFLSTLLLILHGIEEIFTGFYDVDPISTFVFKPFLAMGLYQATFLVFQIMLWLALILLSVLIIGGKWRLIVLTIPGFFLIFEIQHVIEALVRGSYYPGLITALFLPILGIFFWKEWLKNWRAKRF